MAKKRSTAKQEYTRAFIFVTNFGTKGDGFRLKRLFSKYGIVEKVEVWIEWVDGEEEHAFAIVVMDDTYAKRAIRKLDGSKFGKYWLWVEEAPRIFEGLSRLCQNADGSQLPYHWSRGRTYRSSYFRDGLPKPRRVKHVKYMRREDRVKLYHE